jgi:hypothetical protein
LVLPKPHHGRGPGHEIGKIPSQPKSFSQMGWVDGPADAVAAKRNIARATSVMTMNTRLMDGTSHSSKVTLAI